MEECYFYKTNIPAWMFFMFFKLYRWYQVAQHIPFFNIDNIIDSLQQISSRLTF